MRRPFVLVQTAEAGELEVAYAIVDDLAGQVQEEVVRRQRAELAAQLSDSEVEMLSLALVEVSDERDRALIAVKSLNARLIAGGLRG